jgi:hypothetical protein
MYKKPPPGSKKLVKFPKKLVRVGKAEAEVSQGLREGGC